MSQNVNGFCKYGCTWVLNIHESPHKHRVYSETKNAWDNICNNTRSQITPQTQNTRRWGQTTNAKLAQYQYWKSPIKTVKILRKVYRIWQKKNKKNSEMK